MLVDSLVDTTVISVGSVCGKFDAARGVFNPLCEKEKEYDRSGLVSLGLFAKGYRMGWESHTLEITKRFAQKGLLNWEELYHERKMN